METQTTLRIGAIVGLSLLLACSKKPKPEPSQAAPTQALEAPQKTTKAQDQRPAKKSYQNTLSTTSTLETPQIPWPQDSALPLAPMDDDTCSPKKKEPCEEESTETKKIDSPFPW